MNRRSFLKASSLVGSASVVGFSTGWEQLWAGPQTSTGFHFTDVTTSSGLNFKHNNGAYGGKFLPETLGSGCAFLDYDADG